MRQTNCKHVKQVLFSLFGYRFIYIGISTRNPGRLKIGIARNVQSRWKEIDRSMRGKQLPIFGLPSFHALWLEGHLHRVMRPFHRPVQGDGGSEFFTWLIPFSWPGWVYVLCTIFLAFLLTHLLLYFAFSGLWCWYSEVEFLDFQKGVWARVASFIAFYV